MAEGRMLKKAISTSKRLATLKTDTSRLLYTWMLPHLDIEGRFFGDPSIIKGHIVPRLEHINLKVILESLKDMVENDLIIWYENNGDFYIQYKNFSKHQQLRADREKASDIPECKSEDVGKLPELSRSNPGCVRGKIREVKIREDKLNGRCKVLLEEFWQYYGKKINKQDCENWYSNNATEDLHKEIMEGVKRWKESGSWNDPKFQPYPIRFLEKKRWLDEPQKTMSKEELEREQATQRFLKGEKT